ncbi:MAG: DUF6049 family protein [Propionibacteriaceae bacterium]
MRALRALLATLVVATALVVPALAAPTEAHAAEPEALVSISLTSFEPSLPQRDGEITVSGKVTNTSKKRILRPRAYFWRNQAPITDREGFDEALDSPSNEPLGARYTDGSIADLFDADDPYLDAGDSADFTLRVKVADLALPSTSGIYLMGVHVLQNETAPAIGRSRVFVPVLSKAPPNTLQMTSVVALNSRPSLLRKGVFVDDHLSEEIKPGGRLDVLLRAADNADVSFAVDPALVEELQTMKSGYQVLDDDDSTEDGPGQADASRWLDQFERLLSVRDGYRMLYGSVDLAALTHAGQLNVLEASEAAAKTVTLTASLPLLVWPDRGAADAQTLEAAQSVRPAAVLLSDTATKTDAPLLRSQGTTGAAATPIVSYTSTAFGGGPGPDPSDDAVHLKQRLLAESWVQAATEPEGTTLGHVRVISTPAQAKGDDGSVQAPWITQTTLTQLLRSNPAKWSGQLTYSEASQRHELNPAQLADLEQLTESWATWQDLLLDPAAAKVSANASIARVASIRGRGPKAFPAFVDPQQRDLDAKLNSIQISVTRKVLAPKSLVRFPITIRNTLKPSDDEDDTTTNAVRVRLDFTSDNSQRLTVQPLKLETIAAGSNFQSNAVVDAKTNGTVRVTAQLFTDSGQPIGRSVIVDVTATQAGTVGWFIAIGAGIVLIGTTSLRIRQLSKERARAAELEARQSDATRSAPADDTAASSSESIDV